MGRVIGVEGRLHGCAASVCLRTASPDNQAHPRQSHLAEHQRGTDPLRRPIRTPILWMRKLRPRNKVHHTNPPDKRDYVNSFLKDSEDI